ncbi:cobalamin biosynthesis protein [Sphingobium yanoikuyae]|jgi:cobalt-precorrin 5A hydrolase|uniref:Precorrin methylase n=1 Tax=Sphingobium yanoikuyae TaxID=13690 RepID=A0A430C9K5_SPHYA|nr:cobalamin biosynthesis protein [Sphingobium yanoikuyae]RSU61664.1 precorrin methylase [Sphingobium yanoikuyae]
MIVAGFGFRAGATTASLRAALVAAGGGRDVTHLATLADKAGGLAELAAQLALPLIPITADRLASLPTITGSPVSLAARGTGSVAEACALAGAGEGARLRAVRSLSPDRMATCAIAQGASS